MSTALLPTSWRPSPAALLPANPATYDGPRLATWAAMAYLVFITVRSLIHLLLPDGGAQSIATIDVHVAGGSNIVAMFGQWGAIQLLLAGLLWVLLLRWRGLTPLVLLVFADRTLPAQPVGASEARHGDGHAAGRRRSTGGFPGARAAAVDVALSVLTGNWRGPSRSLLRAADSV